MEEAPGSEIVVTLFEVEATPEAAAAFVEREHEFRRAVVALACTCTRLLLQPACYCTRLLLQPACCCTRLLLQPACYCTRLLLQPACCYSQALLCTRSMQSSSSRNDPRQPAPPRQVYSGGATDARGCARRARGCDLRAVGRRVVQGEAVPPSRMGAAVRPPRR